MTELILIYVIVSLIVYIRLNNCPQFDSSVAFRAACWPIAVVRWIVHKCDELLKNPGDRNNG